MSAACCCATARGEGPRALGPLRGVVRRGFALAQWAAPAAGLALLPKCPLCVAGYVAVATGISLSVTAAAYLRAGVAAGCVAALGLLAARWMWKFRSQI